MVKVDLVEMAMRRADLGMGNQNQAGDVQTVYPPRQVWMVTGHVHTEGNGNDIATIAYDREDAIDRMPALILAEHHDCRCHLCNKVRLSRTFPPEVGLMRVR